MTDYPEHERLRAVHDKAQQLGAFLGWLEDGNRYIAEYHEHTDDCYPRRTPTDEPSRQCGMMAVIDTRYSIPPVYTWEPPGSGSRIERILALYFNIDMDKISAEKDAMVKELQRQAATPTPPPIVAGKLPRGLKDKTDYILAGARGWLGLVRCETDLAGWLQLKLGCSTATAVKAAEWAQAELKRLGEPYERAQ